MKMKFIVLFLMVFLAVADVYAQNVEWAKHVGGSFSDIVQSVAVDNSGNVYLTGYFEGTADFDPGPGTLNLTAQGWGDIFIQKLDVNGNLVWVKQIGSMASNSGLEMTLDAQANVYITGYFTGTTDFDPGPGVSQLIAPAISGITNTFVLKLNTDGGFNWARGFGSGTSKGQGIAVDAYGNVYTTGEFSFTVDFDPGPGSFNLTAMGINDVFIQKLDANGNFLWARQIGGPSDIRSYSMALDALGEIYVTGEFDGTVDFDPGSGVSNMTPLGNAEVFVLKLDANGNYVWAKQLASTAVASGSGINIDVSGDVLVTGIFYGTTDFDPGASVFNLSAMGASDIFVLKLDSNGNFIWAKRVGGTTMEDSRSIATDLTGNIYMAGQFSGTVSFNPGAIGAGITADGPFDAFVLKLDSGGNFIRVKKAGGSGWDWAASVSVDVAGNIYTVGCFENSINFSPGPGSNSLVSAGELDVFVQKLNQCSTAPSVDVHNACNSYTWVNGTTYTASNNTATHTFVTAAGCDSIVTLNLTINAVTDLSTTLFAETISANNTNATAYQWLDCNNNYATLANEMGISFTATANGSYAVAITENGCTDTSACVTINTLSIDGTANNSIKILGYPNPSKEKVHISLEQQMKDVWLTLMNTEGKVVYSRFYPVLLNTTIPLGKEGGVYLLNIESGKGKRTIKLMKE